MTKTEKDTLKKFLAETLNTADSMLIISLKDGACQYACAASVMETSYMTDVVKYAIVINQIETANRKSMN